MYCENIAYRMKLTFSNNYKFIKTLPVSSFFHIVIFTYYEESVSDSRSIRLKRSSLSYN